MIMGDFNARTAGESDYNHVYLPLPDGYITDVVMPDRVLLDTRPVTPNGRQLLNLCKTYSIRLV